MKFKNIRTFEHLLKEYGMKPSPSTPPGAQKFGTSATQNQKSAATPKKPNSPTTQGSQDQKTQNAVVPSDELEVGTKIIGKDDTENQEVEVVKATGPGDTEIVVRTPDDEYQVIDTRDPKNKNVVIPMANGEVNEELEDLDFIKRRDGLKKRIGKTRQKIKKLIRSQIFDRQGETLFEINFNDAGVIRNALDAPISCGFEAETIWADSNGESAEDINNMGWHELEEMIRDRYGKNAVAMVEESFNDWLSEYVVGKIEDDLIDNMVKERKEDIDYVDEYVEYQLDEDEVNEFRANVISNLKEKFSKKVASARREKSDPKGEPKVVKRYNKQAKELKKEISDLMMQDQVYWSRKYVREENEEEFEDWLRESIRDNDDTWDDAWDEARNSHDIDDWAVAEYGGADNMLRDHNIFLSETEEQVLEFVSEKLEEWGEENGESLDVRYGDYHEWGGDTTQDYWRVENDTSIEGIGAKAEIISPVYSSPREMIREMFSLFKYFEENNVDTNVTTGLHVTMSMSNEDAGELNPLKLAVLLGDQYLLDQFDRRDNSYTVSQMDKIESFLKSRSRYMKSQDETDELDDRSNISEIEEIISAGLDMGKFTSINFKSNSNPAGNQLVEFRIAGNRRYHLDSDKVSKAVVRYAATLQAAYDPNAYRSDYLKAIQKLIDKAKDGVTDRELKKTLGGKIPTTPLAQVVKELGVDKHYLDNLEIVKKIEDSIALNNSEGNKKAREEFLRLISRMVIAMSNYGETPTKDAQVARVLRNEIKRFGLTAEEVSKHLYIMARDVSPVGYQTEKYAKMVIDKFNKLIMKKQKDSYAMNFKQTIKYSPSNDEVLLMPKGKAYKVLDSEDVDISSEDFVVVNKNDYHAALEAKRSDENEEVLKAFINKYGIEPGIYNVGSQTKDNEWISAINNLMVRNLITNHGINIVRESIFNKFDKLSLAEKLSIISQIDDKKLNEAWKATKIKQRLAEQKINEGAVPDHNVPRDLQKLLSKPLLAGDIKAQMEAYFAIPDPSMLKDFRIQRATAGDDSDLREIVRSYAKHQLHPNNLKKANIAESILKESRGVAARSPGEQYINVNDPNDVLTIQTITQLPPEDSDATAYESLEELEQTIENIIPQDDIVIDDNNPNKGTRAAIIATVSTADGTTQHWIRYIRSIPSTGLMGLWKTLRGYAYAKGVRQENIPVKPSDLISDEKYKKVEELEREILRNLDNITAGTLYEDITPVMQEAIEQAKSGTEGTIDGGAKYFNVMQKYAGEFLGPMSLIAGGNTKGDTQKMLDAYELDSLRGSEIMFPRGAALELVDSYIKTPGGVEIGVSSKIHQGGGSASSLSGMHKQLTDEIRSAHPEGSEIIDILATESAVLGPIKLALKYGIINQEDYKAMQHLNQNRDIVDTDLIQSETLKQLVDQQGVENVDAPGYRVFYHALAAIVNKLIPTINEIPDFRDAATAALNNNTYIQLITKGKKVGEDLQLEYYTKFPAVFQGFPALFNKSYFSTGQKGRLGFKLAKNKPSSLIQPKSSEEKIRAPAKTRPGSLATKKKEPKSTDVGRKEV